MAAQISPLPKGEGCGEAAGEGKRFRAEPFAVIRTPCSVARFTFCDSTIFEGVSAGTWTSENERGGPKARPARFAI